MESEFGVYYSRKKKGVRTNPFVGKTGTQAGIILMNMTRIRYPENRWMDSVLEIYEEYRGKLIL